MKISNIMSDDKKEMLNVDAAYQHLKYFHEGYRDRMITFLHGDKFAEERMGIDTGRYAIGSARRFSYDEGWEQAAKDYGNKSKKIKVFHGTHLKDLLFLKAGTWITESEETARTFGENIYSLYVEDDDVKWEYLSADVCDWNTNGEGEWRGELKKNITL